MTPLTRTLGALSLGLAAACAQAHVPFLKPNQFNLAHDRLHVESAFTEQPFQADFAMDSPSFSLVRPDGSKSPLEPSARTRAAVYLEPRVTDEGTYRISTGVRKGPRYRAVETADAKLYFAEDMQRFSGKPTALQYYSRADTYVAKGEPRYQPRPANQGVEIVPLSSPNQVSVGDRVAFRVLRDGQPVPRARIVVAHDNEHYTRRSEEDLYDVENVRPGNLRADADGRFVFSPAQAGLVFLFVTVHDKVSDELWNSHNASLSLEVNLPAR